MARNSFTVKVTGIPEVLDRFKRLDVAVATRYIGESLDQGVGVIEEAIQRAMPQRTGRMAGALEIKTIEQSAGKVVKGIFIGKQAWYWRFLEFGTKFITPRMFVRRPYRNRKSTANQAIRDTFRDRLLGFED